MKRHFDDDYFNSSDFEAIILKYEQMLNTGLSIYFDVEEFEQIVDYYLDADQNGKALKALHYAFRLHPSAYQLLIKKAQIHLNNKNPNRALNALEVIENIESTNTEVFLTKGHSHLLLGNINESKEYYDKALSIVADDDETLDILQNIAQTLQFSDLYDEAIKYLLWAYELDRENLMVLYDLAFCYDRSGYTEKSIGYYMEYVDLEPYSEHIWFSLGKLHHETGQISKAIEAYEMAVAINPEFTDSIYELAVLLEENLQHMEAIKNYKEFLLQQPDSADVYLYIGNCYAQIGELDQALEHFNKSLKIESNNPEVYYAFASVLQKQEDLWDALFYAKRATLLDETDSRFQVLYGKINARLKMHKESAKAFLKAVELKPELLYHWLLLTNELICEKNYYKALDYLVESLEYHPGNALVQFRLAALYYKTDNLRYSLKYFRKGLLMDPNRHQEFFKVCPEAKRSKEINRVLKNQTI